MELCSCKPGFRFAGHVEVGDEVTGFDRPIRQKLSGTLTTSMPPGAPYHGFILPYSIRVDEFTCLPSDYPVAPKLHLLTHTHADHVHGLSSKSFGYTVVCSEDAKQMLLRHEVYNERAMFEHGKRAEKRRTFRHLKISPLKRKDGTVEHAGRDLLVRTLPWKVTGTQPN